jgi:hypothetical protein
MYGCNNIISSPVQREWLSPVIYPIRTRTRKARLQHITSPIPALAPVMRTVLFSSLFEEKTDMARARNTGGRNRFPRKERPKSGKEDSRKERGHDGDPDVYIL